MTDLWQTRFCIICGNPIPQVGKTGRQLSKWAYQNRKSCGDMTCYARLQTSVKKEVEYELKAIDYFLMGKRVK